MCDIGRPGPAGLDEDPHRRSTAKGWYSKGQSETAFSDAFPFLITSQVRQHIQPIPDGTVLVESIGQSSHKANSAC